MGHDRMLFLVWSLLSLAAVVLGGVSAPVPTESVRTGGAGYAADHAALIAFAEATGCTNWRSKWPLDGSDHCDWYNVSCTDDEDRRVYSINLEDNGLVGNLDKIGALTELTQLGVGNNKLTGTLRGVGQLKKLLQVWLSYNDITGSLDHLADCTEIIWLYADNNRLTGDLSGLSGMTSLFYLTLDNNKLSGTLEPLAGLRRLDTLSVDSNAISGSLEPLKELETLTILSAAKCNLTGTLDPLEKLIFVRTIDLHDNPALGGTVGKDTWLSKRLGSPYNRSCDISGTAVKCPGCYEASVRCGGCPWQ